MKNEFDHMTNTEAALLLWQCNRWHPSVIAWVLELDLEQTVFLILELEGYQRVELAA